MKILHTADVHLREPGDDRWQALEEILEIGEKERIQLLVISGDLFDTEYIGDRLRPRIGNLFSGHNFKILIIPGNHDKNVFEQGYYFGESVHIFRNLEEPFNYEGLRVWGFPFRDLKGPELLRNLRKIKRSDESKWEVLLFHGELLDAFFQRKDFGEEGTSRYLPVQLDFFEGLGLDFILAGHFHSGFRLWDIPGGGSFIYPGSPVAVTRREIGPRKVNLLHSEEGPFEIELKSSFFQPVEVGIDPFQEENPLIMVEKKLADLQENSIPLLEVSGYIDSNRIGKNEETVIREINNLAENYCSRENIFIELRDVGTILQEDIFKAFEDKLAKVDYPDREALWELALRARLEVRK